MELLQEAPAGESPPTLTREFLDYDWGGRFRIARYFGVRYPHTRDSLEDRHTPSLTMNPTIAKCNHM